MSMFKDYRTFKRTIFRKVAKQFWESCILWHCINIGIKHGFSCINIRQVPREVLKTEAEGRSFQHFPRD